MATPPLQQLRPGALLPSGRTVTPICSFSLPRCWNSKAVPCTVPALERGMVQEGRGTERLDQCAQCSRMWGTKVIYVMSVQNFDTLLVLPSFILAGFSKMQLLFTQGNDTRHNLVCWSLLKPAQDGVKLYKALNMMYLGAHVPSWGVTMLQGVQQDLRVMLCFSPAALLWSCGAGVQHTPNLVVRPQSPKVLSILLTNIDSFK